MNCAKVTQRTQTLYNFGQEVCSSFGLLHPVALHDLAVTVDTDIPGAARLGLAIEHGGVRNVVVLKHTLLELTLRSEVLLERKKKKCIKGGEGASMLANKAVREVKKIIMCECHEK